MVGSSRSLAVLVLFCLVASASSAASASAAVLAEDDACLDDGNGGASCAVNALQTHSQARDGALSQALAEADPKHFMAAIAHRLRTTPDRLNPSLLEVHAKLVKHLQDDLTIVGNLGNPASDPIWKEIRAHIKKFAYNNGSDSQEWIDYCQNKEYEKFNNKSCHFEGGAKLVEASGRPIDAYFCGAVKDIDWSGSPWNGKPMTDLCHAEVGKAYSPEGACGSLSDKQLLVNVITTVPKWGAGGDGKTDARYTNVMSLDCLMDIMDCDTYYCQHCPGRCDEPLA